MLRQCIQKSVLTWHKHKHKQAHSRQEQTFFFLACTYAQCCTRPHQRELVLVIMSWPCKPGFSARVFHAAHAVYSRCLEYTKSRRDMLS